MRFTYWDFKDKVAEKVTMQCSNTKQTATSREKREFLRPPFLLSLAMKGQSWQHEVLSLVLANHPPAALQVSTELVLCPHQRSLFLSCLTPGCLLSAFGIVINDIHLLIKPFLGFPGRKREKMKRNMKKDMKSFRELTG